MAYIDKIRVGGTDYDLQDSNLKNAFLLDGKTDITIQENADILSLPVGSYVSPTAARTATLTNKPEGLTTSFRLLIFTRSATTALTYLLNAEKNFYVAYRSTSTLYPTWRKITDEATIEAINTEITNIKNNIKNIPVAVTKIDKKWFEKGGINASGENTTYREGSRARTSGYLFADKPIQISLDLTTYPNSRFSVFYYDVNFNFVSSNSWETDTLIPAGSNFRFMLTLNYSAASSVTNTIDEIFACITSGSVEKSAYFRTVKIATHQGNVLGADTNHCKIDGYITAGKTGYDFVEGDVKFTSDNVPVLCHDSSFVDATSGETITISQNTLEELKTNDYYGGKIASLAEVLAVCKKYGMGIILDQMKSTWTTTIWDALFEVINEYRYCENCKFIVYDTDAANAIKSRCRNANFIAGQGHSSETATTAIALADNIVTDYNHVDVLLYNGLGEAIIQSATKTMDARYGLITYHNDTPADKQTFGKYATILLTNVNSALFNY